MSAWVALIGLIAAICLLIVLSVIDLRARLLPNKLVLPFALLAILFHITTKWQFLEPTHMLFGALIGFGSLFLIRAIANYVYKQDTLGLGDVKLMGAAGLWLGPEMVMMALSIGAFAGLLHGIAVALYTAYKNKTKPSFSRLQIPAGPGFAIGIVLAGAYMFQTFRPWE